MIDSFSSSSFCIVGMVCVMRKWRKLLLTGCVWKLSEGSPSIRLYIFVDLLRIV